MCRAFRWRRPDGALAVRGARELLVRLEEAGLVRLPEPRRAQGRPDRAAVEEAAALLPPVGALPVPEQAAQPGAGTGLVVRPVDAGEILQ